MKSSKTNATIHYKLVTFKVYVPLKFPRGVNCPFSESQIHHIGYISGYIPILSPKVVGVNPHFSWRSSRWITSWAVFNMLIEYWLVLWNHGILWLSIQLGMSKSQLTNSLHDFCRGVGLTQPPTSPNQHLGAGWISCGHLLSPWNPMDNSWKSIGKKPIYFTLW